ncbi:hypothetical protein ICV00_06275 [Polynucleobacter asymbioticus]|nr:hypothetical protein ICV00_06275 [Polynucleobacter asymbioticus]
MMKLKKENYIKESIYSLHLNPKIKESSIASDLNEMNRFIKQTAKRKGITVLIIQSDE